MRFLVVLTVALATTRAFADPKAEAKKHVEKAMEFHGAGKFEDALGELTLAYSLDPQPNLLFAIGQVHVKLGQCTEALDFYQRFLATKPPAGPADEAKQAIATCKQHGTLEPLVDVPKQPKGPVVAPKPVEPIAKPPPPPAPPSPPAFYTDIVGDGLVAGGAVVGVVGILEYASASSDLDSADKQTTYGAHQKLVDDASGKRTLSIVLGVAGSALVAGGIFRFVTHDRTESDHGIAIVPAKNGGAISWSARF